jgi:glycosyltransferase involved in cell wall biosynthesis
VTIAFLLPFNVLAGGLFNVYEHARQLAARGHDVCLFFERDDPPLPIQGYPGLDHVRAGYLAAYDGAETFDVAIATWWETVYVIPGIAARHYAYLVQGFEDRFYTDAQIVFRPFIRETYRSGFHFLAVSEALRRRLEARFGQQAALTPPAVDIERFARATPALPPSSRLRVLVEGHAAVLYKRVALAFEALETLKDVEVVYLAHDGSHDPGCAIHHRLGPLPHHEVPGVMASCDLLLKLSREESVSLPVVEMFAAGGTAVVAAFEGHDEYLRDGDNSLVVPLDDVAAARAAVRRLAADPALVSRLKAGGRRTVRDGPWSHATGTLEACLRRIVAGAAGDCGWADRLAILSELNAVRRLNDITTERRQTACEVTASNQS